MEFDFLALRKGGRVLKVGEGSVREVVGGFEDRFCRFVTEV